MAREELLKVAKPILFSQEMVKAILEGRKTVTRRAVKYYGRTPTMDKKDKFYKIDENLNGENPNRLYAGFYNDNDVFEHEGETIIDAIYYPLYFKVGDILYVRETWLKADDGYYYRADETSISKEAREQYGYKWKPSIHMPKSLARIFLKVMDVRVERLQDITEEQAIKEGVKLPSVKANYVNSFIPLWNSTIKKQDINKYGWDANPFVWVIEFERINGQSEE